MAINLKIETLNNFNELIHSATKGEDSFPDNLCNFLVNEFEYQAIVLFELLDSNGFKVIGKSLNARKNSFFILVFCSTLSRYTQKSGGIPLFDMKTSR